MEKFSLEIYKQNGNIPLVNGKGNSVRILTYDRMSKDYPIVALVGDGKNEAIVSYTKDGRVNTAKATESEDLYFDTKKHKMWACVYSTPLADGFCMSNILWPTKEDADAEGKENERVYVTTVSVEWEDSYYKK
jgi:hypothetical protein